MSKPFPRLRGAATDGRLANVYKRQTELEHLHKTFLQNSKAIVDAIIEDSGNSSAEAAVEYHLSLASLKQQYALLNPTKAHEEEYKIAHGADVPDRREANGLVYIVPTYHTLFFSVVAPVSAAIAAGNCVIVEVRDLPILVPPSRAVCADNNFVAEERSSHVTWTPAEAAAGCSRY